MGKRDQEELPGTRRADETPAFKPIKKLDENIKEWQRKLGQRKKLTQGINALLVEQQELLEEHERDSYPYESESGSEREIYRVKRVASRKTKTKSEIEDKKGRRGRRAAADAGEEASADE